MLCPYWNSAGGGGGVHGMGDDHVSSLLCTATVTVLSGSNLGTDVYSVFLFSLFHLRLFDSFCNRKGTVICSIQPDAYPR